MKGTVDITVRNNKTCYKLTINRNITVLRGDSATGKTILIDLIDLNYRLGNDSGVDVICNVPCVTLEAGPHWMRELSFIENSVVFIDEGNAFIRSHDFARTIKNSSNYYVLATRDPLSSLPYSVEEVYGLKNRGRSTAKYPHYKRIYASTYRLYGDHYYSRRRPQLVIVEDSNSGYEFYRALCKRNGIRCASAQGKSNIRREVIKANEKDILVIADGAAFGPEMERALNLRNIKNLELFLPESFEWIMLSSGLFREPRLQDMLKNPASYIESGEFFSWEQFFTQELINITQGSALEYKKEKLNKHYLEEEHFEAIESALPSDIGIKL